MEQNEIQNVKIISCSSYGIDSLKGIEYFYELERLQCSHNDIEIVDLSQNKKLQLLECDNNKLRVLDVSHLNRLVRLVINNNDNLKEINLSGCCPELYWLECDDCPNLQSFVLGRKEKLSRLECLHIGGRSIDISQCPQLIQIVLKGKKSIYDDELYYSWIEEKESLENGITPLIVHGWLSMDNAKVLVMDGYTLNTRPSIYMLYTGTVDNLYYNTAKGFEDNSFIFDFSAQCALNLDDNVPQAYENVKIKVMLPDGLSFNQNTTDRLLIKELGTMHMEGKNREDLSLTIYIDGSIVPEKFEIQAELTADGYDEPQTATFTIPVEVIESALWHTDFHDASTYQALYIYENQLENLEKDIYGATPSSRIYDAAKKNGLVNSATIWQELQNTLKTVDDPSKIMDMPCKKQDIYEGIIFSILETNSEISKITYNTSELKDIKSMLDIVKLNVKTQYNITIAENGLLSDLDPEQKSIIGKAAQEIFDNYWKGNVQSKDISDIFKAIQYMDDFAKYIEYVANCYEMREMSESYKAILRDMYAQCPDSNYDLKAALTDCIVNIELGEKEMIAKMQVYTFAVAGKKVVQTAISEMWKEIKSDMVISNPYVALFWVSYKTSTFLTNKVFGADAIAEKTVKMGAMMDIRELLCNAYDREKARFLYDKSEKNALIYLAVIDVFYQYLDEDCKLAIGFVDSASESLTAQIEQVFGNTTYDDTKATIKIYRGNYSDAHDVLQLQWLYNLQEDHPEEYKRYLSTDNDKIRYLKKKYYIACPVDVYVYDQEGVLVASVAGNDAYCNNDLPATIVVNGEEKELLFYESERDYTVKYVSTDKGIMDVTIEEFSEAGEKEREIKHVDIPLAQGIVYQADDNAGEINMYSLHECSSDNEILPILDTNEEMQRYTVTVVNGYIVGNENLEITADCCDNDKISIQACEYDGYVFQCWKDDAKIVSTDKKYTFIVKNDCKLVAEYKKIEERKFGDVNGDRTVNRADRMYLARAIAGWDGYDLPTCYISDLNGDGAVNRADRMYLARAIAGWEGYNI